MPERPDVTAALRYTGGAAPEVIAAGRGELADRILARAREAGVPVHRDSELADSLARLALGAEVPEELWLAVAEVLAWAYSLGGRPITPKR
jgi:flagellar biosynthesis protein